MPTSPLPPFPSLPSTHHTRTRTTQLNAALKRCVAQDKHQLMHVLTRNREDGLVRRVLFPCMVRACMCVLLALQVD